MLSRWNCNYGKLVWFFLRRERLRIFCWLICLLFITLAVPVVFSGMYATQADRQAMLGTLQNPAMVAMVGPIYGAGNFTLGAIVAGEMILFTLVAVAIMNIFLVVRHTRRDEERGRIEVIRSLPVGRLSTLSATMIVATLVNLVLALLTGLGLYALGLESMGFSGSMLYGACMGATGIFFAAVTALFCQICSTSRGAVGYSMMALGVLYMLRAVGDMNNETLARISPLGLILRTQVYVKDLWWPVPVVLLLALVVAAVALYLNAIRDMDQGFIPERPGSKTASALLQSPLGLAFRLLRTTIIAWLVGLMLLGATYGSIMNSIESFLAKNEMIAQMLPSAAGFTKTELFSTMLMAIIAIAAAIPCLSMMLKLKGEEERNHNEHLLARAVSRSKLMGSYLLLSLLGSFCMLLVSMLGLWSASSAVLATPVAFMSMFKAAMVYLPALWVMIGLTAFLIGAFPDKAGLVWIYLGASFFVVYFGGMLKLPDWVEKLSPFGNVPRLPIDTLHYGGLILLTAIALVLMVAGFLCYRRRDARG